MPRARSWPEKLRWIKSIQKLVKMGADVHRFSETRKLSLLHEVLALEALPWEVQETFDFWLLVLSSSGVNITRYLKVEANFYYDNHCTFIEDWDDYRRILTLDRNTEGEARFGWEWWVDPEAPGYEVVKEFKQLDDYTFYGPKRKFKLTSESEAYEKLRLQRFYRKKGYIVTEEMDPDETRFELPDLSELPGTWID